MVSVSGALQNHQYVIIIRNIELTGGTQRWDLTPGTSQLAR